MNLSNEQKSTILDWLSSLVNHNFIHHFSDRWISVDIYNNLLVISFDFRQSNQVELFDKLPNELKGIPQKGTGIIVNERTLYFKLSEICSFEYPSIVKSKLIKKEKHQSGSGGWIYVGEYFYTYDWEILLSDGTTIYHHNQVDKMDLIETKELFRNKIEEREFINFINTINIKKNITFDNAKDLVVKNLGYSNWKDYESKYAVGLGTTIESNLNEAVELYAKLLAAKAWDDACDKQIKYSAKMLSGHDDVYKETVLNSLKPKNPYR